MVDRLSEAHAAVERSNSFSALPNRHHAYRCGANRWLAIAWKLWQTHQPYDEAYHFQQRVARSKAKI